MIYTQSDEFRFKDEGEIIVGITERSIFGILLDSLGFHGITWNFLEFLENLHKIPLEFLELLWDSWNSDGISNDEKFQLFPPRQ